MRDFRYALGTVVFLICGPILWALHFTFIYGAQSALCGSESSTGGHHTAATAIVAGLTLVALLSGLLPAFFPKGTYHLLAARAASETQWAFFRAVMRILMALSLLAIAYEGSAVLFLPACAPLR